MKKYIVLYVAALAVSVFFGCGGTEDWPNRGDSRYVPWEDPTYPRPPDNCRPGYCPDDNIIAVNDIIKK